VRRMASAARAARKRRREERGGRREQRLEGPLSALLSARRGGRTTKPRAREYHHTEMQRARRRSEGIVDSGQVAEQQRAERGGKGQTGHGTSERRRMIATLLRPWRQRLSQIAQHGPSINMWTPSPACYRPLWSSRRRSQTSPPLREGELRWLRARVLARGVRGDAHPRAASRGGRIFTLRTAYDPHLPRHIERGADGRGRLPAAPSPPCQSRRAQLPVASARLCSFQPALFPQFI
jgi:hypothetical protein